MPGYGGGVGADTDGDNADYGEGMGTKGAAASDNSIGMGSESDKDFGNTVEGFRAALAKALGQVTQEQKDKAVEAQKNLEAKNQEALTKKTGISVAKTTEQISKEQQLQNLIDNFDPKAKLDHNPHLESLEPGAYDANVSLDLDQQLDLGLISQFEYDATKAQINQDMPIGKNYDLGIKNMPTVDPNVEDVDQETRMGAFRNISYGSFPSAVVDNGLLGAAIDDPQGTQEGLDAEQEAMDAIGRSQRSAGFRGLENKAMGSTVENNVDRQAFENAMKESAQAYRDISGKLGHPDFGFRGTAVEGAAPSGLESNVGGPSLGDPGQSIGDRNLANRNRRAALALESFNNLEQTIKRDPNLTERERARKLKAIQDTKRTTEYGILVGYAFPGQTIAGIKTSTLAKALASLLGLGVPIGIMSVLDKTLGKKGFGQVERDALTSIARDIEESGGSPATAGYGGGSDEIKRKFYDYIIQVEPWAKGLSDRQINYYLENEEELEWVRNLYKDMTNA
jgi:hypothetical protein